MTDHVRGFVDFSRAEVSSGGPDPQVLLTARALEPLNEPLAAVAAGYFVAPYTCGAAAAMWSVSAWAMPPDQLQGWLVAHTEGVPTRRERRVIWGKEHAKLVECLHSWQYWASTQILPLQNAEYSVWYQSIMDNVRFFGRYATMKVLEVLHQRGIGPAQTDIRGRGAKFPRRTLAQLFPEYDEALTSKSDSPDTLLRVDGCAGVLKTYLLEYHQLDVTWFQLETLLCNYRQSLNGKYPGRSHDRELAHWKRAENHFGPEALGAAFPFYQLRSALFPHEHLGERGDPQWWGARSELEEQYKQKVSA